MAILSSSLITYENIYSQSHANLFNLINTRSNVPDPADTSGNRKFVYVREPRIDSRNFEGFPIIIIPSFSVSQSTKSLDASKSDITFDIVIRIWTQDNTSDNIGNPLGAEQLNTISDNILKAINTNRNTLRNYGMAHFELSDSDFDYDVVEGKTTYQREFILTFKKRTQVTA